MEYSLQLMYLLLMHLHLLQLCSLTIVAIDLQIVHLMELYAHGNWRWGEGAMSDQLMHVFASMAMHRISVMLPPVGQSLPLLGIAPMVLMWLCGTHLLPQQVPELLLCAMKVVPAPLLFLIMIWELVPSLPYLLLVGKRVMSDFMTSVI
uniref:Uncharacterized protein n=1 Tax=Opuntia streptacantha TaxID=393608 RepID=A0A7C9AQD7_OPUST